MTFSATNAVDYVTITTFSMKLLMVCYFLSDLSSHTFVFIPTCVIVLEINVVIRIDSTFFKLVSCSLHDKFENQHTYNL